MSEVTQILEAVQQGNSKAAEELLPLVYEELRRLAAHKMASEQPEHTLQPTALVHEAWLRLVGDEASKFENRTHFFHLRSLCCLWWINLVLRLTKLFEGFRRPISHYRLMARISFPTYSWPTPTG